jgi:transposase
MAESNQRVDSELVDHHADFDKRNEIGETKEKPETPMPEKFIVNLSTEEREYLHQLTQKGKCPARTFKRAHILLLADEGHTDETIAQMLHVGESTVHRTRQKCVDGGVEFALKEAPRPGGQPKLDRRAEAMLIATACSDAPTGQKRWTMQMLADRLVELQLVDSICDETVRRVLEKTTSSRG